MQGEAKIEPDTNLVRSVWRPLFYLLTFAEYMLICERILFRINKDVAHIGSASDSYFTVCELSRPKDSQSRMSGLVPALMALV